MSIRILCQEQAAAFMRHCGFDNLEPRLVLPEPP